MDQKNIEYLAGKYPELITLRSFISVGNGWLNIIDTLCSVIVSDVRTTQRYIEQVKKPDYLGYRGAPTLAELEAKLEQQLAELPSFAQIKEKFGTLRVYTNNANDTAEDYVRFAEALSARTCEVCGNTGRAHSSGGWLRTLCNEHSLAVDAGLPLE